MNTDQIVMLLVGSFFICFKFLIIWNEIEDYKEAKRKEKNNNKNQNPWN